MKRRKMLNEIKVKSYLATMVIYIGMISFFIGYYIRWSFMENASLIAVALAGINIWNLGRIEEALKDAGIE